MCSFIYDSALCVLSNGAPGGAGSPAPLFWFYNRNIIEHKIIFC